MRFLFKIILSVFLISLLLPLLPAQAAGSAIMRLTSAKTDYNVGDLIYVDIMVEPNGASLNTVRAIMDYNGGNVIAINDFVLGTAWPNQSPGRELDSTTNHINVGGFILVDTVTQNSKFGTLIFKANQVGSSTINFATGSHLIAMDQTEQINLSGCQGITINVSGAAPPPPPPPPRNEAPTFSPVGNKQINLGESVNFHVQAIDSDNDDDANLTWDIPTGAGFSNVINHAVTVSGNFSWTPTKEGIYTTTFIATDENSDPKSSTLTVSIGVSVPPPPQNHAPVFEPVAEKTINAGDTLTFNVTATDPDKDNVTLSLEPVENAILTPITTGITSTSRFSWTPKNFGIYYLVFKAQDDNKANPLSSSLSVRITVFGGQCPPCVSGGGGSCPLVQCQEQVFASPLPLGAPVISSPSHPISDQWYANNQPQFVWQANQEGTGYVFNLNQTPLADPTLGYTFSQDKLFSFSGITDGAWFFHLKVKYDNGYGPTAHYQVKIDTTPPEFFKPSIETGILADSSKQYKLYFSALDKSSGVAYYEMKIDTGEWQKVPSPYVLNENDRQGKVLTLRAVDNAGNAIESYVDLEKLVVIEKKQETYNIEKKPIIVSQPTIDHVILPQKIGTIWVKNILMVTGRAQKGSIITLHLSSNPESVFSTQTNGDGIWMIYLNTKLDPGKYNMYAVANLNGINSLPSDMVSFTLAAKFVPTGHLEINTPTMIEVLAIMVGVASLLIFFLKKFLSKIVKKKIK